MNKILIKLNKISVKSSFYSLFHNILLNISIDYFKMKNKISIKTKFITKKSLKYFWDKMFPKVVLQVKPKNGSVFQFLFQSLFSYN